MTSSENFDPTRIHTKTDTVYGIRMHLRHNDPFEYLLGEQWHTTRWYATQHERDHALVELKKEHRFSRQGDAPTLRYECIEQPTPDAHTPR